MDLNTETKVINAQDGEPGLVLDRYGPDAYEVMAFPTAHLNRKSIGPETPSRQSQAAAELASIVLVCSACG
jgi:hypothetical protein